MTEATKRYRFAAEREVKGYAVPRSAARRFNELATANVKGSFYTSLAAVVFSAFQVEGVINHASVKVLETFDRKEERRSWYEKLTTVARKIGWQDYQTNGSYPCIEAAFAVRDMLAHPKNERLVADRAVRDPDDVRGTFLEPAWESECKPERASAVRQGCDSFCRELVERMITWGPMNRPDVDWELERYEGSGMQLGSISVVRVEPEEGQHGA